MASWTFNYISVDDPKIIDELMDNEGNFDFNKIVPMPESLDIESGSMTDESILYYKTSGLTINPDLLDTANRNLVYTHVSNTYFKDWPMELYMRLKEKNYSPEEHKIMMERGQQYCENIEKYGCPTWYEWCNKNWGTKWNACDTERCGEGEVMFQTAWAAPTKVLEAICKKYPEHQIEIKATYEEGFVQNFFNDKGTLKLDTACCDIDMEEDVDD